MAASPDRHLPAVPASQEMVEYLGHAVMAPPTVVRTWFEDFWRSGPFTRAAIDYFRGLRLEIGSMEHTDGGGFWFGDRHLVLLNGVQTEAAIHELAHSWWERERASGAGALLAELKSIAEQPPSGFPVIGRLAHEYTFGIPTQADERSPTGFWRGMLVDRNDHEVFAGVCSGCGGNATLMPPALRRFYRGLLRSA